MEPWSFDSQVDPQAFAALGYALSSAGIAKRQREYREGWWAHAERSKAFIMNAAIRARGRKLAVLLGAGKAYDLPLAELAKGFERIVLVDIDADALAATIAAAVPEAALRRKFEPCAMDLTGVCARLAREIQSSNSYEELCASYRLASPPRLVPGAERADLLVSALVLTQLALPAKLLARDVYEKKHGPVGRGPEPAWVKAFDQLDLRMQQDHIDALNGQAELAVLTSEVMHHITRFVPGGADRLTGESWSLIGAATLDERVSASQEIVASSSWGWPRIRANAQGPGARMDVGAVALRARSG
ncbi:MAG TPA: hypothetical protein VF943_09015 [Burkholderiales bacterium]